MHAGFCVLEVPIDESGLSVAAQYTEHGTGQSLGYGVDWKRSGPSANGGICAASASFYDKLMHTWELNMQAV